MERLNTVETEYLSKEEVDALWEKHQETARKIVCKHLYKGKVRSTLLMNDEADDILVLVYIKVTKFKWKRNHPSIPIRDKMFTIQLDKFMVPQVICDYFRAKKRRYIPQAPEEAIDTTLFYEYTWDEVELPKELLLMQAQGKQYEILLLWIEGKTHKDIAALMGINETHVRTAIYKARKKLARAIEVGSNSHTAT